MTQAESSNGAGGTLADALSRITAKLARIEHDTRVSAGGETYTATSINAIADLTRPLLAAEGIVIAPIATTLERHDEVTSKRGAKGYHIVLRVTWAILRGAERLEVESMGASLDYSDKGYNKAQTFARKNLLVALLNLSTGENPDAEAPEAGHREAAPPPSSAAPRRQQSAPPAAPPPRDKTPEEKAAALIARGAKDGLSEETIVEAVRAKLGDTFGWPAGLADAGNYAAATDELRSLLREIGALEPEGASS